MGHMIDGKWVNDDRIPADARGHFVRAQSHNFAIGLPRMEARGLRAKAASRPNQGVIICTCRLPAHGLTGPSSCVN